MATIQLRRNKDPEFVFVEWKDLPAILSEQQQLIVIDALEFVPHSDRLYSVLTQAEKDKAERHIRPTDRWIRIVSRAMLRLVLARNLQCDPDKIYLQTTEKGKPFMPDFPQWHFNVSHSAGLILIYVSHTFEVGCDVEEIKNKFDFQPITERFFHVDEKKMIHASRVNSHELFFRLWAEKESFLKCIGSGVWDQLRNLNQASGYFSDFPPAFISFNNKNFTIESCTGSGYAFALCTLSKNVVNPIPFFRLIGM